MATNHSFRRALSATALTIAFAALTTGCCGPMGCGTGACGSSQGLFGGPIALGAAAAGNCGGSCGGSCGNDGCNGCGETYIDEWINTPPMRDSCDSCGNHNGQTCGSCRPILQGLKSIWGFRCDGGPAACQRCDMSAFASCGGCDGGGCDGGCSGGCDGGCSGGGDYAIEQMGESYTESMPMSSAPRVISRSPQIVEAKPAIKPYTPQRTKQIFKPRDNVAGSGRGTF